MKTLYLTTVCVVILASCNNVNDSTVTFPSTSETATELTVATSESEDSLRGIILQLCRSLPDYVGKDHRTDSRSGMSRELLAIYNEALEVPTDEPDGIGSDDMLNHWLATSQESDPLTDGIKNVTIETRRRGNVTASLTFSNCNRLTIHRLSIVKENGKWKIDDFDGMKQKMKDYIIHQLNYFSSEKFRNRDFNLMSESEERDYDRSVSEFLRKHRK